MKPNKLLISYVLAIVAPSIALGLTNVLLPLLYPTPSVLFFVAITLTTWYGGLKPGLIAIVLSLEFIEYYLPPADNWLWETLIRLIAFCVVAIVIHRLQKDLSDRQKMVDQLQQVQTLLAEKESILQLFIRYSPAGIAMFDREMRYLAVSQRWVDEYRLGSIEAIINRCQYDVFPNLPDRWRQVHKRCLNGAVEKSEADLYVREDGSKQWLYWEVHPWYRADQNSDQNSDKNTGGIIIFSVDFTDLKGTHDALRSAKEDLEIRVAQRTLELQNRTDRLDLIWNITQKIRQSLDLQEILGVACLEIRKILQADRVSIYKFNADWSGEFVTESVDSQWVKLVNLNCQKVVEDTYLQENQGGRFRNQEIFKVNDIYNADLQPCHIELLERFQAKAYIAVPIFVGQVLWGLLVVYQNANPRIWQDDEVDLLQQIAHQLAIAIQQSKLYNELQLELQERQRVEAKIREAERRWRSLLDNVKLLVVGLDQFGTIDYVNSFFLETTGYTRAELLGKNWIDIFLPPTNLLPNQSFFQEFLLLDQDTNTYYPSSILIKSGEERLIAWNNTLLRNVEGDVIGKISIGQDITERQKLEDMKNEFIGVVSHELRTPLTAIQMSLGLLNTGIYGNNVQKSKRMIEIALADTKRLVHLVNNILDLERLESSRMVLEKEVCFVQELMEQAVNSMKTIAHQQEITVIIAPTETEVWVAPDSIIQTLANLLSNALKFSPAGSTISLQAKLQGYDILFQVSDQGRGIPPEKLEAIFERFQQVDASDARQKGGTGLGLSICRSIIERHGGKIWAESTLGQGSTFYFTLPASE